MIPIQRIVKDYEERMMCDTITGHLIMAGPYNLNLTHRFMACQDVNLKFQPYEWCRNVFWGYLKLFILRLHPTLKRNVI